MLIEVITGGQTGVDQAGWRAAKACNLTTGGWMPLGFLTEDGPRPEFAEAFGAVEMPTPEYRARTRRNVEAADATLWFGSTNTTGGRATLGACLHFGRPHVVIEPGGAIRPLAVAAWIQSQGICAVNVAGSREREAPGIGARVERFLCEVFRELDHEAHAAE